MKIILAILFGVVALLIIYSAVICPECFVFDHPATRMAALPSKVMDKTRNLFTATHPAAVNAQNFLHVAPLFAVVGEPVNIAFNLYGPDGCYRQSPVATDVTGNRIVHRYRIWTEGDDCTDAIVTGGFTTSVTLDQPGMYLGEVCINGRCVAEYWLRVFPDKTAAQAALNESMSGLSDWELAQVKG